MIACCLAVTELYLCGNCLTPDVVTVLLVQSPLIHYVVVFGFGRV